MEKLSVDVVVILTVDMFGIRIVNIDAIFIDVIKNIKESESATVHK